MSNPADRRSNPNEMATRLELTRNLNQVTNKIHATSNIDEIMLDVSKDICTLFNADRLTIYMVGDDKSSLVSKVKTGLNFIQRSEVADSRTKHCRVCCV